MSEAPQQPAAPPADPMTGVRVGEYLIQRVLGRGGMGVVYEAEDTALGIPVALKSIEKSLALDASFVRRFRTEARAMARIASPHIVSVKALRETELGLFIVMEYVDGGNLHDVMANGAMPWESLWPMLRQMLLGLEAAHAVGVVHRDIKPRNVLLTKEGTVKLTDFGLARFQTDGEATVTQAVAGTLSYMSPEQIRSLPDLDGRSDLFSLALTAYEALAGKLPFDRAAGEFSVMRAIVEDPFPSLDVVESIPAPVAGVLMKALEKDPANRYQTAEEFREALAAAGDDLTPTQTRVPPVPRLDTPPTESSGGGGEDVGLEPIKRDPFRVSPKLIGGLAAVLVAILGILWFTKPGTITPVSADGVSYFINDEPFEAEMELPAGPVTVRCLAGGLSASAEIEVRRGAGRSVECFPHDQTVDVSAFWDGAPADATVSVDGGEPRAAAGRVTLSTGRHSLRVVSTSGARIDSTIALEVRPSFDPETPAPLVVAIRGGNDPEAGAAPVVTNQQGSVAQSGATSGAVVTTQPATTQTRPNNPVSPPPRPSSGGSSAGPSTGQLVAEAAPGVTLSLDGSGIGQGSRDLSPGSYTLTCQAGALSATQRVTVRAGQSTPARCYAPSQVVVVSATSDDPTRPFMTIVINGEANGQTPGRVTLPPGRNTVFVRRRGFEVVGQDIVTVDVPPRFSPGAPEPLTLSFQTRAVNAP